MKSAVVILNYNGRKHLETFLPSVVEHSTTEIVVIDNGSTDDSVAFLEEKYHDLHLVKLSQNHGFAGGYNEGLKSLDHDIFILLNSDVEVTAGWDATLLNILKNDSSVIACQPKVRAYLNKSSFEHAGASGGYLDYLGYAFCRGRIFDYVEEDQGQYDDVVDLHWATGAACAIRAEAFHKYGGFDADYFAHFEEIDLCWRLINMGYKIKCVPDSIVYHLGGGTLPYNSPNKIYLNFRNSLFSLVKNDHSNWLWGKILYRLILDGVAGLKFLSEGKAGFFRAVLRAHGTFYAKWGNTLKKRKVNKQMIAEHESTPPKLHPRLIIWQYFIRKKRTFSSLHEKPTD